MKRTMILSALLVMTIVASFIIPIPKYESLNILQEINIPTRFADWRSMDISKQLNLQDDRYNFISDVFARMYQNQYGEQLLLLVLDAGNFHNPKVCYTSSGFTIKELDEAKFPSISPNFQTTALLMQRPDLGVYMYYWLCIDKKIVSWTGQKIAEIWSSLSNRKKAGLMVRLEIPTKGRTEESSRRLAKEFIQALNGSLTAEQKEYLFGK